MKFFIDNTFGRPMVEDLRHVIHRWHPEPIEIQHLLEIFHPGESDAVWVPQLIAEDWVVISADRGKKRPRLHDVCRESGKTLIVVSASIHGAGNFEHLRTILAAWPQIMTLDPLQPQRYQLRYSDSSRHNVTLQVRKPKSSG